MSQKVTTRYYNAQVNVNFGSGSDGVICYVVAGENSIYACVSDYVSIQCSEGPECVINVQQAIYWHPSDTHAQPDHNCTTSADTCAANATDVWEGCHGKSACAFYVRQQRAPGVHCTTSPSFALTIEYGCNCSGKASSCVLTIRPRKAQYKEHVLTL